MFGNILFLIAVTIVLGRFIGGVSIKNVSLGSSGSLIIGLTLSYVLSISQVEFVVPSVLISMSLIGFIVSVGLMASSEVFGVIRKYGFKFVLLALVITGTGAFSTWLLYGFLDTDGLVHLGTYVGALTSSPGLAAALEVAPDNLAGSIGLGYSLAYVPGILVVIIFTQLLKDKEVVTDPIEAIEEKEESRKPLNLTGLMVTIALGIWIGSFKLAITDSMVLTLGKTGGVLVAALLLGNVPNFWQVSFSFQNEHLKVIRDISLNIFLACVGLKYGAAAVGALSESGMSALIMGVVTGAMSISTGYLVGRFILQIEKTDLIGGICGGMTSTPGLASAVENFDETRVTTGYGATYPFALIFMILFTNLLYYGG